MGISSYAPYSKANCLTIRHHVHQSWCAPTYAGNVLFRLVRSRPSPSIRRFPPFSAPTELDLLVQMTLLLNGDSMSCIKEQKRSLCVIICQGGEGQTWQGRKAQEKRRGKQAKGKAPRLWKRQSVGPSKIKRSARKPYSRHQCTTALASPSFASHLLPPPTSESFSFFPPGAAFFCEKRSSHLAGLVQAGRS